MGVKTFLRSAFATLFLLSFPRMAAGAENLRDGNGGAKRVVSLSPALTETVFRLGRGDRLVGRSEACDHPAEALRLPVAGRFGEPDAEKTAALNPDLVIANAVYAPQAAKMLKSLGIKMVARECGSNDDYCRWVAELGELLDCRASAAAEIASFRRRIAELESRPKFPCRVLWLVWSTPPMTGGAGSLIDTAIRTAGGENVAGNVKKYYFEPSIEWLMTASPDVMVWTGHGGFAAGSPPWNKFEAVRRGRVIDKLEANALLRPGPRFPDALRGLRRALREAMRLPAEEEADAAAKEKKTE